MDHVHGEHPQKPRRKKRSLTSITLDWIAQRMRRTEKIKRDLQSGHYQVESTKIAQAILNED